MSFLDLLWIFLLVSSLWPMLRPRMLEAARYRLVRQIETQRGTRVIILIHRQETISILGIPIARYKEMTADRRRTTAGECHAKPQ